MLLNRRSLTLWVLVMCTLLSGMAVYAESDEPQPSGVLTMDEAIRLALVHSPDISLAKFAVLEAEFALREAEINQLAGRPLSELEMAQRALVDAQDAFIDALNDVALQVQEAYYEVIRTAQLNEVQAKNGEQTERQLNVAITRYEAGLIARHEMDEVALQADQSRVAMAAALDRHEDAVRELSVLVGRDDVIVDDSEIDLTFTPLNISLDRALAEAFATRREIAGAQRELEAAERQLGLAAATFAPPVEINRLEMNAQRAAINLMKAEAMVTRDIVQSYNALKNAETNVSFRAREEDLAKRRLDITAARYDAGMIALSDLVTAERNATQSELDAAGSVWDYTTARVIFLKKIGRSELPPLPAEIEEFVSTWID